MHTKGKYLFTQKPVQNILSSFFNRNLLSTFTDLIIVEGPLLEPRSLPYVGRYGETGRTLLKPPR